MGEFISIKADDGLTHHINVNHIVSWLFVNNCLTIGTIRREQQFKGGNTAAVAEWLLALERRLWTRLRTSPTSRSLERRRMPGLRCTLAGTSGHKPGTTFSDA